MPDATPTKRQIDSVDPSTGTVLASFDEYGSDDIERALAAASRAQAEWGHVPIAERVTLLVRMAAVLRAGKSRYATLITNEMGKPLLEAEAEIEKCAWNCEFYAEKAEVFLAAEAVHSNATESMVVFDPLGIVLAIMPWNYPFWQLFRFLAPALAAGNGAILKHASNVPQCALAIEEVVREAGAPEGLFRTLLVSAGAVEGSDQGSTHRRRDPDRLDGCRPPRRQRGRTGAEETGARTWRLGSLHRAGGCRYRGRRRQSRRGRDFRMSGRAASRPNGSSSGSRHCRCLRGSPVHQVKKLVIGDPMQQDCNIGPMARADLRDDLHSQVDAHCCRRRDTAPGGKIVDRPGYFYEPTVLDHVTPGDARVQRRNFRARRRGHSRRRMRRKPSRSPTRPNSALAPPCGLAISRRRGSTLAGSKRVRCSSTVWWRPIRACRSAASSNPATAAS